MAKTLIKFAGPDSNDEFKCLSVKGRLRVNPGHIYNRHTLEVLDRSAVVEVTTIEPKFETLRRVFDAPNGVNL